MDSDTARELGGGLGVASQQHAAAVVVLTALSLEYRAVRARLVGLERVTHAQGTVFEVGRLSEMSVRVALGCTGAGNMSAAVLAGRAIEMFRPRAVFFVGVAGALKDDLEPGDVVVATRVFALHGGKEEGSDYLARPRAFEAAHELLQAAEHADAVGVWQGSDLDGARTGFRVHFKPIAAGEVVLDTADSVLRRQVREHYNDAAAIEMESAGAAQAAHLHRNTAMLTVRGISDRADGRKHAADADGGQPIAAAHAAEVALTVVREWAMNLPSGDSVPPEAQLPAMVGMSIVAPGGGLPAAQTANVWVQQPGSAVSFPCQVGVIPPEAECFQVRSASEALEAALVYGETAVLCQVLSGAGGVGKTQVAARYARGRWTSGDVDLLVWLPAGNRESVLAHYARAAAAVGLAALDDVEAAAWEFVSWLASTDRTWLVVLDDLADPGDLTGLWPPAHPSGRTVVTTRRRDAALTGSRRRPVQVGVFTQAEAETYVATKLAAHGRSDDPAQVTGLARDLGFLPVGLAQAVAYLVDTGLDCRRYRARWADRRRTLPKLVPQPGGLPDDQSTGLAAVWSLSVRRANTLEPAGLAGPMLEIAALLDPNGIPLDLLTAPSVLMYLATHCVSAESGEIDREEAGDALSALARLSLCTLDADEPHHAVRIHALIQRATRESLPPKRLAEAACAAADALVHAWPEIERDRALSLTLRTNTENLDDNATDALWLSAAHPVLFRVGESLGQTGLVGEAVAYYARLHQTARERLGPDHPDTLTTRGNHATWRGEAGDATGAAAAAEELLADQIRVLGRDHPKTLATRGSAAFWRGEAGDAAGAAAAFEELFADRLQVLGPDHPLTLSARGNLARWRGEAGDPAGAAATFQELLAYQLQVLGPDHPDTLTTRGNHATWRGEAGDPAGAVTAFEELLAEQIRVLGPDHPNTLTTRYSLARSRDMAGDLAGAVVAFEELLADDLRVLGPDHPDTLITRYSLARSRGAAGDLAGAVVAFEELLADDVRVLGPDHPNTLITRRNLIYWHGQTDDLGAVAAFEELLVDCIRVLVSCELIA